MCGRCRSPDHPHRMGAVPCLDVERLRTALIRAIIVDLRNIYKPAEMRKRGFRYVSVGRPDIDIEKPIQRTAPAWGDITAARLGSATLAGESSISNDCVLHTGWESGNYVGQRRENSALPRALA